MLKCNNILVFAIFISCTMRRAHDIFNFIINEFSGGIFAEQIDA